MSTGGKKPPPKITETYLRNAGLHYLQRYAASTASFRRVMMRKIDRSCRYHTDQDRDACVVLLDRLIHGFQEYGYLNDDQFTQIKVRNLRERGISRRMIVAKLRATGLDETSILTALEQHDQQNNDMSIDPECAAAMRFARKKRIGPFAGGRPHAPEKSMASMARAGFSYDAIRFVMDAEIPSDGPFPDEM